MASFTGTTTILDADEEWASGAMLRNHADHIQGSVFAGDEDGTLYIEQSLDGENWDVSTSYAVTADDGSGFNETLVAPYWRVRYVNGSGGAQGAFRIGARAASAGEDS